MGIGKVFKQSRKDAKIFAPLFTGKTTRGAHSTIPAIPKKTMKKAIKAGTAVKRKKR